MICTAFITDTCSSPLLFSSWPTIITASPALSNDFETDQLQLGLLPNGSKKGYWKPALTTDQWIQVWRR